MIVINVCKANSFGGTREIKDRMILINGEFLSIMSSAECARFYEKQADAINKALYESLPQGTYDLLGIKFMQRKVSLYQGKTGT